MLHNDPGAMLVSICLAMRDEAANCPAIPAFQRQMGADGIYTANKALSDAKHVFLKLIGANHYKDIKEYAACPSLTLLPLI
jgi:hypothetical protein